MTDKLHIVLLLGSIRQGRRSHWVARMLMDRFSAVPGVHAQLWDLAERPLPLLENRWAEQSPPPQSLAAASAAFRAADALVLISPEYHGSYTGVLKNAVDHFWKEFHRKPIGVAATGAGRFGGLNASTEMQQLVLSLGAFPMPYKLLVPFISKVFDAEGNPVSPELEASADTFVQEFLWFARALAAAREPVRA